MGYVMVEAERRTQAEGSPPFGFLLKTWRQRRKLSQLDLALEAGVSQRHLSFLESGRSRPSRSMALHLAAALDLPLRERNHLLLQAGFAAAYDERSLSSADMTAVRQALELTLRHHEPFPAIVIDRAWNLVLANQATFRFLALFGPQEAIWARVDPSGRRNVMRLSFHPAGLQAFLRNWREAAGQGVGYRAATHRATGIGSAGTHVAPVLDAVDLWHSTGCHGGGTARGDVLSGR